MDKLIHDAVKEIKKILPKKIEEGTLTQQDKTRLEEIYKRVNHNVTPDIFSTFLQRVYKETTFKTGRQNLYLLTFSVIASPTLEDADFLIDKLHFDVDYKDELGHNLLATLVNSTSLPDKLTKFKILWLKKKGANINLQDNQGKTALIDSIRLRNFVLASFLITITKADPNISDRYDYTPLIGLIINYNDETSPKIKEEIYKTIEQILDNGADPNVISEYQYTFQETPLTYAILNENDKILELLLRKGANPEFPNGKGETPNQLLKDKQVQVTREIEETESARKAEPLDLPAEPVIPQTQNEPDQAPVIPQTQNEPDQAPVIPQTQNEPEQAQVMPQRQNEPAPVTEPEPESVEPPVMTPQYHAYLERKGYFNNKEGYTNPQDYLKAKDYLDLKGDYLDGGKRRKYKTKTRKTRKPRKTRKTRKNYKKKSRKTKK